MNVLITGANGMVGHALVERFAGRGDYAVSAAVRTSASVSPDAATSSAITFFPDGVKIFAVGDLAQPVDWSDAVADADVVIHTAARVHQMHDTASDPLEAFRTINRDATQALAMQAAAAGVRRFIFLSTIKVNGEATSPGTAFTADDVPAPQDAYAISKMEAEQKLRDVCRQTGMELVIIRPPLVYGPGVKANFRFMMRCLARRLPLPLGAIGNRRSLVALDNMIDLIDTCMQHPAAANQIFLAADGEDLSTTELLRRLGRAMKRPAILLPIPVPFLKAMAALVGRGGMARRLCDSLQINIEKNRLLLDWQPPVSVDEALRRTCVPRSRSGTPT